MINLWQLQVFLDVNETGSFSAAATKLHMTQPGVSQQIRSLETYLNVKLFVRRGHGVELTAAGQSLVEPARRLIALSQATEDALIARRGEVSGRIRLGCALPSGMYVLYPWLAEFRDKYPDVTVQVEQLEPGPLLGSLRAQELDGGLVLGRMRGRGLQHHKLFEDPVSLIVHLSHPWAYQGQLGRAADGNGAAADDGWAPAVKLNMLTDQPLVLEHGIGESRSDARRALTDALDDRGLNTRDLRIVMEVPTPMAVACAVAQGIGVGIVPQSIARLMVGQVVPVRIEGFSLSQHAYLINDRKAMPTPATVAWWKFIAAKTGQATPPSEPAEDALRQAVAPLKEIAAAAVRS
ncbi:MAG TPA: LysR family transcriptional regulator [Chloroflexia bacterium]|nr:LysR family transcriptional regulator [Chloroflexia bacterium]